MNLRQLNQILLQTLLIPVVALLFVASILALQIRKAENLVARIQATSDNIATATLIGQLTVNEVNGIRGFQLTGDSAFLQSYTAAQAPLQKNFAKLRKGIVRSGGDPEAVDELVLAHDTWHIAFAEPMIQATRNGTDTRDIGLNIRAQRQTNHVIDLIARIIYSQQRQRSQMTSTWRHHVHWTLEALIALALVIGIFMGVAARNRIHRVSSAFQNTLEDVRANAQLTYDSEQRLRTMLTSIGEGIIVCDRRGCVELLNPVAEQLTGWRLAEALHEPLEKIFRLVNETTRVRIEPTGESFPQLPQHDIAAATDPLADHPILIRRNGVEVPIEESEAPILDRAGRVAGVVIVFRDITEQRRAQTTLVAAEKLAVSGRLAATLAHEIHNPLDSVINLLYLLRSDPTPDETIQFLDLATREVNRVSQISRAMLGMYREPKEPVAVHVQDLFESILLLMQRPLREAQIKLHTEFAPDAIITGYPAELRQVFINLIVNATEASSPNDLVILRTKIVAERRRNMNAPEVQPRPAGVEISIADTGTGISADTLHRLFQPFFTTKGEKGTGLSLWVSRGIIEKHNGDIDIRSSISPDTHGTTVTVFLPRGNATL